jgi:hypothetical protein
MEDSYKDCLKFSSIECRAACFGVKRRKWLTGVRDERDLSAWLVNFDSYVERFKVLGNHSFNKNPIEPSVAAT